MELGTTAAETSGRIIETLAWVQVPFIGIFDCMNWPSHYKRKRIGAYWSEGDGGSVIVLGRLRVLFIRDAGCGETVHDIYYGARDLIGQAVDLLLLPFRALPLIFSRPGK